MNKRDPGTAFSLLRYIQEHGNATARITMTGTIRVTEFWTKRNEVTGKIEPGESQIELPASWRDVRVWLGY